MLMNVSSKETSVWRESGEDDAKTGGKRHRSRTQCADRTPLASDIYSWLKIHPLLRLLQPAIVMVIDENESHGVSVFHARELSHTVVG
jgi:hypothetical protein